MWISISKFLGSMDIAGNLRSCSTYMKIGLANICSSVHDFVNLFIVGAALLEYQSSIGAVVSTYLENSKLEKADKDIIKILDLLSVAKRNLHLSRFSERYKHDLGLNLVNS